MILALACTHSWSQVSPDSLPGKLYWRGQPATFQNLVEEALKADVVFFGEMHDNRAAHQWELALYKAILAARPKAPLGMEMLEADNQMMVDEYASGLITEKQFGEAARLWGNYLSDYRPIVEAARQNRAPIIATNVPRRYASLVTRKGLKALDSLPAASKACMAPLPLQVDYHLPSYEAMLKMAGHDGMMNTAFVDGQALKDATMAYFVSKTLDNKKGERPLFHLNGSYHTDSFEGIVPYLIKLKPKLKVLVITTVPANTPQSEWIGKATFALEAAPSETSK